MSAPRRFLHVWQASYPWEVRVGKINRALVRAGFEGSVIARRSAGEPKTETVDSVRVLRVGVGAGSRLRPASLPVPGNPLWANAIDGEIRGERPALVIVRDIPLALSAARAARRHGVPVILDMAEHYPEAMRSWKKYSDSRVLRALVHDMKLPDRLEARAVSRMDGILVVCEEQKERLVREYAYPADRICVVHNTPELSAIRAAAPRTRSAQNPTFGYHGILCEDRELEVVLKGFDLLAAKHSGARLLIAGGGESESSLRALAAALPARGRIELTGRYAPAALAGLYARADYGIVSLRASAFTENTLANKFFDYAALGKPFIFPDLAPLKRVMRRMSCGVAFRPGSPESVAEAMRNVLAADYEALSARGTSAVAGEFNWDVDSRRMLDFLAGYGLRNSP